MMMKVVFSNGKILSVSVKSESVNKRTHTDQQNIIFHILRVARSADELIRQLLLLLLLLHYQ